MREKILTTTLKQILGCVGVVTNDFFGKKNHKNAWEHCNFVFFPKKTQNIEEKNTILGCVGVFANDFFWQKKHKKPWEQGNYVFFLKKKKIPNLTQKSDFRVWGRFSMFACFCPKKQWEHCNFIFWEKGTKKKSWEGF